MNEQPSTLNAIRQCLALHLPKNGKALLFGSQARGTAHPNSDWDILIILDKEKLLPSDYDEVTFPLMMLGWETGQQINPILYSAKEWDRSANTPFHKNVEQDAIQL